MFLPPGCDAPVQGGQLDGVGEVGVETQVRVGRVAQQPVRRVRPLRRRLRGARDEPGLGTARGRRSGETDAPVGRGVAQPAADGPVLLLAVPGPRRVRAWARCRRRAAAVGRVVPAVRVRVGRPQDQRNRDERAEGQHGDGDVAAARRAPGRLAPRGPPGGAGSVAGTGHAPAAGGAPALAGFGGVLSGRGGLAATWPSRGPWAGCRRTDGRPAGCAGEGPEGVRRRRRAGTRRSRRSRRPGRR